MSRFRRLFDQDDCCVSPVCVARGPDDVEIEVCSQKLACRNELGVITVFFVANDTVVHQVVVELPLSRYPLATGCVIDMQPVACCFNGHAELYLMRFGFS